MNAARDRTVTEKEKPREPGTRSVEKASRKRLYV
jgi:hypothetical protein